MRVEAEVEYGRIDAALDRLSDFCGAAFAAAVTSGFVLTLAHAPHERAIEALVAAGSGVAYAAFGPKPKRKTIRLDDR